MVLPRYHTKRCDSAWNVTSEGKTGESHQLSFVVLFSTIFFRASASSPPFSVSSLLSLEEADSPSDEDNVSSRVFETGGMSS